MWASQALQARRSDSSAAAAACCLSDRACIWVSAAERALRCAEYFKRSSAEEREHAEKLMEQQARPP